MMEIKAHLPEIYVAFDTDHVIYMLFMIHLVTLYDCGM